MPNRSSEQVVTLAKTRVGHASLVNFHFGAKDPSVYAIPRTVQFNDRSIES